MLTFIDFDNIRYALKRYKHQLTAFAIVFIAGLILGTVFHRQIEAAQWLLTDYSYSGTILGSSFVIVLWNLFFSALLIILIVALTAAAPYVSWLAYVVVLVKSLSFASAMITLISCFSVIGIIYALIFLIYQAATLYLTATLFILVKHSATCSSSRYLKILKESLPLILTAILVSLLLTLVICVLIFVVVKAIVVFL